jgi:hypothetical protein
MSPASSTRERTPSRDEFRLAARPRSLVRAALAVLSVAGRLRGYGRAG